jgi:hypothetical protein
MSMPSLEIDWDLNSVSVPLSPLLTGIYRANVLCFMIGIIVCLLIMLAVGYVMAERAHAAVLELHAGQAQLLATVRELNAVQGKLLEAVRDGRGAPRSTGCPDVE